MAVTIVTTAKALTDAYFNGRTSGSVRAPEGLTSEGREVRFITVSKGSHKVTLTGMICGHKWEEVYPSDSVKIDD